jgi:metal-responsive CopG/Arc/MetJ family transcriptional regulator
MTGRPATGQTPPISFRPPVALRQELDELAKAEGRDRSDVLIEAAHDWIRKKRREQGSARQD